MATRFDRKTILFTLIVAAIPVISIELIFRLYFASQVGADVLLYGITSTRYQNVFDPGGAAERQESTNHTVDAHDADMDGYWKYSPYQDAIDHNSKGEVFKVTINSKGFRGPEFEDVKKPGTLRVVTLGASSTFGYHDKDDETYPILLQTVLSERLRAHACGPFTSVEVINLGIAHLASSHIHSLFKAEGLPLQPDVVTFYEGINDAHEAQPTTSTARKGKAWLEDLLPIQAVYKEMRARIIVVAMVGSLYSTLATSYDQAGVQEHARGKVERFLHNVSLINDETRKKGILFIAASQQAKSNMIPRDELTGVTYGDEVAQIQRALDTGKKVSMGERDLITHNALMQALGQWAAKEGVGFVDLIKALDTRRDTLETWVHLNGEANQVVASTLGEAIVGRMCRPATAPAVQHGASS
jgi:lysophospholipase L1-like esterase